MSEKLLVLAVFDNELAADDAAQALKDTGAVDGDAMGILVLDADGKLKVDKVGARSTGKGAGIGGVLLLLGPAAVGVGVLGGAAAGALHHKGLGLDAADQVRITEELQNGRAAVGVMAPTKDGDFISQKLQELGGTPESHPVSDEALEHVSVATPE